MATGRVDGGELHCVKSAMQPVMIIVCIKPFFLRIDGNFMESTNLKFFIVNRK